MVSVQSNVFKESLDQVSNQYFLRIWNALWQRIKYVHWQFILEDWTRSEVMNLSLRHTSELTNHIELSQRTFHNGR